ncbi:hypothetical protein J4212_01520 [Candidatus Woesearchaeota archaeon]|nr:hypothetical protein [Candidatus Woesearchaeota archaeon]
MVEDFKKHWSNEIKNIEKSELDRGQCNIVRHHFSISQINLLTSMPMTRYTHKMGQDIDLIHQLALERAYSRYRKSSWWYKLLSRVKIGTDLLKRFLN